MAAGPSTSLSADGLYVDPSETSTAAPNPEVQRRFDETDQGASLTSVCDLVYAHVGEGTKQKIWNGEFVELGALINTQAREEQQIKVVNGELHIGQAKKTQKIERIETWSDAFIIFMSIYLLKHPDSHQELLSYLRTIRMAATRFPGKGWAQYDDQFRLRKARRPNSNWASIDGELWLLYMSQPLLHSAPNFSGQNRQCFAYNNRGFCTNLQCNFQHRCIKCLAFHPALVCPQTPNRFRAQMHPNFRPTVQTQPQFPRAPRPFAYRPRFQQPQRQQGSRFYAPPVPVGYGPHTYQN